MKPSKVQSNASIIKEQGEALRRNHILVEQLREANEALQKLNDAMLRQIKSGDIEIK